MNFIYSYNEVDLNFIYKSTLKRIEFLKNQKFNNNSKKPILKLMINFNNVIEPDFVKIYDYVLILWLMTGGRLSFLRRLDQSLRRGTRYYRFILFCKIYDNFRYFKFMEFLIYSLFNYVDKTNINIFSNKYNDCHIVINNVKGFTNLKFFTNFYLIGIENNLIVRFNHYNANKNDYFCSSLFFLSLFKINARNK